VSSVNYSELVGSKRSSEYRKKIEVSFKDISFMSSIRTVKEDENSDSEEEEFVKSMDKNEILI
jgi:hypothetical protein